MSADNSASFTLTLDGKQMVVTASEAASSLAKLGDALKEDAAEIARIQKAMRNMQAAGTPNVEVFNQLTKTLEEKKRALAQNTTAYVGLGGKLEDIGKKSVVAESAFSRLSSVGKSAGILSVAAAVALATGAIIKYTKALYDYGVAQAEASRNEKIQLQNLTTVRNYWGIAAGKASDLTASIDRVSASSSLSRSKIGDMAKSLYQAGFRGENLSDALEGVATKTAVQGEAQASIWLNYARSVALAGGSVKKMSETVKAQLGGQVQAQMLSSEVQAEKLQESYTALFGGLKIDALLKAKKGMNDFFSQSSASGRALKTMMSLILQPLVDVQAKVIPIMKRFFQGMILSALQFTTVVLDMAIWIHDTFGIKAPKDFDLTKQAVLAGKTAFWALSAVLLVTGVLAVGLSITLTKKLVVALAKVLSSTWQLATDGLKNIAKFGKSLVMLAFEGVKQITKLIASFASLAVEVVLATWPILLAAAALWGLYKIGELFYTVWKEIDWTDIARNMWKGLVGGIEAGWTAIEDAVTKLGNMAKNTLKNVLGIHSPSTIFEGFGTNITEGLKLGIEGGQPEVDQTVRHLVEVPKAGAGAPGGATGRSTSISFGNIYINSKGGDESAQGMAATLMVEIEKRLTEAALEMGVAV